MNARQGFIGQSVARREDARFLTGRGQYTDDISLPGQTYGYFLRSPHAHAKITALNTAEAAKAPGVLGIFTGEHFKAVGGLPCGWLINSVDGTPMKEPKHPVLADGNTLFHASRDMACAEDALVQLTGSAQVFEPLSAAAVFGRAIGEQVRVAG